MIYRKDGSEPGAATAPRQESHLMDLLDISLGATNISSPPPADAWGMPRPQVSTYIPILI